MSGGVEQLEGAAVPEALSDPNAARDDVTPDSEAATSDGDALTPAESRALAAWEIASVFASVVVAAWGVLALGGVSRQWLAVPVGLAVALVIYSQRERCESLRDLGWRFDNFGRALLALAPMMLAATLVLVACGWLWFGGRVRPFGGRAAATFAGYAAWGVVWGLVQQYVLQGFINRRAQIIFGAGWRSVLLTALVFALLHLPNPWLAAATFLAGLGWAHAYQREPNLFALALSHAVLTWALISTIPASALEGLRVGFKYFG